MMICLTLSGKTIEESLEEVNRNRKWIDLVELRLDLLKEVERERAREFPLRVDLPVILTARRKEDGGEWEGDEKKRRRLLLDALDGPFSYIDIEEDIKKGTIIEEKARENGVRIIRSIHDFSGIPIDLVTRLRRLSKEGDIVKAAVKINGISDLENLFKLSESLEDVEKIILGMGEYGVPSRILYRKMGSLLSFSSEVEVAPGQLTPKTLKEIYHVDSLNQDTKIYGVIGCPVLHSSSPQIHNKGFEALGINGVYVPFSVDDLSAFFSLADYLPVEGFSVTIPYKTEVLKYLGNIKREVKIIGSSNTVFRDRGLWMGINTDYYGFLLPILGDIESGRIKRALVIGAGGAAKAVVWALRSYDVKVTILNRTEERARTLADFNLCDADRLENACLYEGKTDLIVQTTSLGMVPNTEETPLPGFHYSGEICYDLVYKPKVTRFLREAIESGCPVHYGSEMLIEQGKLQFKAFTGYDYPEGLHLDI